MTLAKVVPGGEIPVFLAGVLSHLALDAVPHGDSGIGHWVNSAPSRKIRLQRILPMSIADQLLTVCLFALLLRSPFFQHDPLPTLIAGAAGSVLPDYISGLRDLLPHPPSWLLKIHQFHDRCHFRGRDPFNTLTGLIFQIALVVGSLYLAFHS